MIILWWVMFCAHSLPSRLIYRWWHRHLARSYLPCHWSVERFGHSPVSFGYGACGVHVEHEHVRDFGVIRLLALVFGAFSPSPWPLIHGRRLHRRRSVDSWRRRCRTMDIRPLVLVVNSIWALNCGGSPRLKTRCLRTLHVTLRTPMRCSLLM